MKIISITEIGKRKKTVTLLTDDETEVKVDGAFILNHSIREGMVIDDGVWDTWLNEWRRRKAMDAALRYLGYRSRTSAQMEEYLAGKDYPAVIIGDVIGKLKGYGYLDDMRYAREYLASCRGAKPVGRLRIRASLRERGIDEGVIEEVLSEYGEEKELDQALACLRKQMALRMGKRPEIQRQQSCAALARRGFNWETIRRAWGLLEREAEDDT